MLSISVLGSVAVVDEETGATRRLSSRSIALLGLLVAEAGRPQRRATIAGLFWPESGDAQALTNLRRELHELRSVLGDEDGLEVTTTHLCWHDHGRHTIDLATFLREASAALGASTDAGVIAHGRVAVAQYRGPLLPSLDADWIDALRARLDRRCREVCTRVAEAAGRAGSYDIALAAVRRCLDLEPFDEAAHRRLMELHAARGDRAGAINSYHRFAGLLERELGIEPDPQTRQALARIVGGLEVGPAPGVQAPLPTTPPLVGRDLDLDRARAAWRSAAAGRQGVLAVVGEPGVGKTRLVAELQEYARSQGAVVAFSRCFDMSGRLSLSPVADWLREPDVAAARAGLDAVWRAEVDRLVPGDGDASAGVPRSLPGSEDAWQRYRFFEGVARALLASSRPLLLVLDNAQGSDPDTLSFTRFLLNLAPSAPVLLTATLRPPTSTETTSSHEWLAQLDAEGLLTEVALAPLDRARTAELATRLTGETPPQRAAEMLHDATGGFPLFVLEAARGSSLSELLGGAASREGWLAILAKRIRQTSPVAREVAGLGAALGRDFTIQLLVEASDLPPEAVVAGVDELWRQRIVTDTGSGYDFSHDLLRDAAYAQVSAARRWLLHRRLAQALELTRQDHMGGVDAQIAEQYRRAGNIERAMHYYVRAADAASSVFAHEESIALLGSARDLLLANPPSRDRNERELALLELTVPPVNAQYGYASPQLREACERSLELAEELGSTSSSVNALVGLWASRFVQGRTEDCYAIAERATELTQPGDRLYAQAHFSLAGSALHRGDPVLADREFRLAEASMRDEALTFGTRARVHAMAWWAHTAWTIGELDRAAELARAATHEAGASGHQYSQVVGLAYEAVTLQLLGRVEECAQAARRVRELCRRYQFTYYGEWGQVLEGWATGGDGGIRLMESGLARLAAMGARARRPYWLSLLAQRVADARRVRGLVDEGLAACEDNGDTWWLPELLRLRADCLAGDERRHVLETALSVSERQHSAQLAIRIRASLEDRGRRLPPRG